jgi:sugar phosphate isomerase/epimerase
VRLAASNIGWPPEHLPEVLPQLSQHSVEGLVIAPTMVWQGAPEVSEQQAGDFRKQVEDADLVIAGMQSLTFGLKDAALSGDPESRKRLTDHLKRQAELAGYLGAGSMIFGSPGLRKGVNEDQAIEVFSAVAQTAADNGTRLCIEPLSGYGNEFVRTTVEGVALVERLQKAGQTEGFGLHLDAAAIAGQPNANPRLDIAAAESIVGITSFDASAPELLPPSQEISVPHAEMGRTLRAAGFAGFVSLEMRAPQGAEDPVAAYLAEVDFVSQAYGFTTVR